MVRVECTQVNAVHVLDGLPFWVDYCIFPASATAWPIGCKLLFERQKVAACDRLRRALRHGAHLPGIRRL